jgi:hypothetical protein
VLCRITLSSVPKMLYLCRCFALLLVAAFGLPLVTAAAAGTVSRFLPVARSLYALRRCVAQGAGGGGGQEEGAGGGGGQDEGAAGGGGQEEGGGGGEKKASLIDRCNASAECACCFFCMELGAVAVTFVSLVARAYCCHNTTYRTG